MRPVLHFPLVRLRELLPLVMIAALACGEESVPADAGPTDDAGVVSALCDTPGWTPGPCVEGAAEAIPGEGNAHVAEPEVITWDADPPASGAHREQWARWGEYETLGPERWLHNLEHGGITLLYHPCADPALVEELRAIARSVPDDATGAFRWILAPYPDLPSAVMVIAWEWRYAAECVDAEAIRAFIDRRYRQAPEDVRGDGSYADGWLGR